MNDIDQIEQEVKKYLLKKYYEGYPIELYDFIGSEGDHNTRCAVKKAVASLLQPNQPENMKLTFELINMNPLVFRMSEDYILEGCNFIGAEGFWKSMWNGFLIWIYFIKKVRRFVKEANDEKGKE